MNAYRSITTAKAKAPGKPIVRIGDLYIAFESEDLIGIKLTQVELISPEGRITGHVGLGHLDRLGNANYATAGKPTPATSFEGLGQKAVPLEGPRVEISRGQALAGRD